MEIINFKYSNKNTILNMKSSKGTNFQIILDSKNKFEVKLPIGIECSDMIKEKLKKFCQTNAKDKFKEWKNIVPGTQEWIIPKISKDLDILTIGTYEYLKRENAIRRKSRGGSIW